MSEFKLHHLVHELLKLFGSEVTSPEEIVEYLEKNIDKSQDDIKQLLETSAKELARISSNHDGFIAKLKELEQKRVNGLGPFMELLRLISQDPEVKEFIKPKETSADPSVQLKKEDLLDVKNKLKNAVKSETKKQFKNSELKPSTTGNMAMPSTPSLTSWFQRRPTMSWDFSTTNLPPSAPVANNTSEFQEHTLIQDLLNIFMGLPGNHILPKELKHNHDQREFEIPDGIDVSLREMILQMLPLATYYSMAQRFVEEKMQFQYGPVNNALAEAIHRVLMEYLNFITQLESDARSGSFNMMNLWLEVQNKLHPMELINELVEAINSSNSRGGQVLTLLQEKIGRTPITDNVTNLWMQLLEAASVPYLNMLSMWLYRGGICDPLKEFLIEDNEVVQKENLPVDYSADYWDKKYTIRRERIPKFMEQLAGKILLTGKYLNVISQCDRPLKTVIKKLTFKLDKEQEFIDEIQSAYAFASKTLLDLIIKEKNLLGHLRAVKNYFLLEKGHFFVTFLTLCDKDLRKDVKDILQPRLDSLLELALRLTGENDPFSENLKTELLPYDLQRQMFRILSISTSQEQEIWANENSTSLSVINSFSFNYVVHWPLSLILNRKSLACYQMLFRHLFFSKYVERMLCQVWRSNTVVRNFPRHASIHYRNAFALRQRMLQCVQNLEYHMMVEVIEPHWATFIEKVSKVNDVEEILSSHSDFIDSCMKDCMLMIPDIFGSISKILQISVDFCDFMKRTQRYYVEAELGCLPSSFVDSYCQSDVGLNADRYKEQDASKNSMFEQSVNLFELEFTGAILTLLDQINKLFQDPVDYERLFNLLHRLDFNGFYSAKLENFKSPIPNASSTPKTFPQEFDC